MVRLALVVLILCMVSCLAAPGKRLRRSSYDLVHEGYGGGYGGYGGHGYHGGHGHGYGGTIPISQSFSKASASASSSGGSIHG